jgi:protein-glutamine gamma-glutamyltransferase
MNRRARDLQAIGLTAFAAVPLYLTQAVAPLIVGAFHLTLALVAFAVLSGRGAGSLASIGRVVAIGYLPLFAVDALWISSSLIKASVHLLFFVAIYQILDPEARAATRQRLLVTFLIFTTSIATATHLSILLFILLFSIAAFAELMRLSSEESAVSVGRPEAAPGVLRSALLFAIPTILVAAMLFPMLPRRENPFVRGVVRGLQATTGISDSINFNEDRRISSDPSAIARVWLPQEAVPFFTPLRLRAAVYDEWEDGEWVTGLEKAVARVAIYESQLATARSEGFSFPARVEQKAMPRGRMLLPDGTWAIRAIDEVNFREPYGLAAAASESGQLNFEVSISRQTSPLLARPVAPPRYPVPFEIESMARQIVGAENDPIGQARRIEAHLRTTFTYLGDPSELGRPVPVDEFLLATRRGHCEYFAAGMVVLLAALDVPARIVGGYYGGELNPLIGSFVLRARDAHAWVEVWDGSKWVTHDPTPPALRPGISARGLMRAYLDAVRDSATYFWDRYILTFGRNDQVELLMRAFIGARESWTSMRGRLAEAGAVAKRRGPAAILMVSIAASIALAVWMLRRRRTSWERLLRLLDERGIASSQSTAPRELLEDVRATRPDLVPLVEPIVEAYVRERFAAKPPGEDLREAARAALRQLQST